MALSGGEKVLKVFRHILFKKFQWFSGSWPKTVSESGVREAVRRKSPKYGYVQVDLKKLII